VKIGDVVEAATNKIGQTPRTGTVTAVSGTLLTVQWDSGGETTLAPAPGSLSVVRTARSASAKKASRKREAPKPAAAKTTAKKPQER